MQQDKKEAVVVQQEGRKGLKKANSYNTNRRGALIKLRDILSSPSRTAIDDWRARVNS